MKTLHRKHKKLNTYFLLFFLIFVILISSCVTAFDVITKYRRSTEIYTNLAMSTAQHMTEELSDLDIQKFSEGSASREEMQNVRVRLDDLRSCFDLENLYYVVPLEKTENGTCSIQKLFVSRSVGSGADAETVSTDNSETFQRIYDEVQAVFSGKEQSAVMAYSNQYGNVITACFPVTSQNGEILAVSCADVSMTVIYNNIWMEVYRFLIFIVLLSLAFIIAGSAVIRRHIVKPLSGVSGVMEAFAFNTKCDASLGNNKISFYEIDQIQTAFEKLSEDIDLYIQNIEQAAEVRQKMEAELAVAAKIQRSVMPSEKKLLPRGCGLKASACLLPAKQVGGDFYDFFLKRDGKVIFFAADVSDKGVPAALFMILVKQILSNSLLDCKHLEEAVKYANDLLIQNNRENMFVTAFICEYDKRSEKLRYVNAGHNPPLLKKASGEFVFLPKSKNFVLGLVSGANFNSTAIDFREGDRLFIYTDGITEAENQKGEFFGESRLQQSLNQDPHAELHWQMNSVLKQVKTFSGEAPQSDDITVAEVESCDDNQIFLRAEKQELDVLNSFLDTELRIYGASEKCRQKFALCAEEIFINIVNYAYEKEGGVKVRFSYAEESNSASVEFRDTGKPFDPLQEAEKPDLLRDPKTRKIGGLGVFLVKQMADDAVYRYENGENIFTFSIHFFS